MATTIRLARHGAKKHPFYRIIVTDSRAPRNGRRLDQVGTYDPSQQPAQAQFEAEKLAHWLRRGARPSLTVAQLIKRSGLAPVGIAPVGIAGEATDPTAIASAHSGPAPVPDPGEAQT